MEKKEMGAKRPATKASAANNELISSTKRVREEETNQFIFFAGFSWPAAKKEN